MNIEETKKAIEVMQAYCEGKQIEYRFNGYLWKQSIVQPSWDWNSTDYRIAKQKKTVKLNAWFDGIDLFWRSSDISGDSSWKRVPSEDKTIEVEE